MKALVVDDEGDVVELVDLFLRLSGWDVVCARAGHDALRLAAAAGGFDLYVIDVWMRPMNGCDLVAALHAAAVRPAPVLFITGGDPARQPVGPSDAVLRKPFTRSEFIAAVERARSNGPITPIPPNAA